MFSKRFGLSSSNKERTPGRSKSSRFFSDSNRPDLPSNGAKQQQPAAPAVSRISHTALSRSASTKESHSYSTERRGSLQPAAGTDSDSPQQSSTAFVAQGLSRSHTIRETTLRGRREGSEAAAAAAQRNTIIGLPSPSDYSPSLYPTSASADASPSAYTLSYSNLPSSQEQPEHDSEPHPTDGNHNTSGYPFDSMSGAHAPGKTSHDAGSATPSDRWSQRRLQRLNTEQGFREQRQGGHGGINTPSHPPSINAGNTDQHAGYNPGTQYANSNEAAQPPVQPHPLGGQGTFQAARTPQPNAGLAIQTPAVSNPSRSQPYPPPELQTHVQQYSPPTSGHYPSSQEPPRPPLNQTRSFNQQAAADDSSSMSNNGSVPPLKSARSGNSNRQSVHNGLTSREGSHSGQGGQAPSFNAPVQPPTSQGQSYKGNSGQQQQPSQQHTDVGRGTPQPVQVGDEMTPGEVDQLVKDHKELREKYTKVKKYYFEKEDQVKQLQNSLAHQRLSQSRTSLDDSEYTTRFNRLDGLIAQLAFSIRKSWKSIPQWLSSSVNKDAVATGKQEMTAAGRAFISCWLVEEVFDKYFHPDLDPSLSTQLKSIQRNIRKSAPTPQTTEEEENLTAKVVNWRMATLEGLNEALRSASCPENRQRLTDTLKDRLVASLSVHLVEPAPSDLEGGVHMIIELVVSIAIHLPVESRDVVVEYFMPGFSIMSDQMKIESGIPPLTVSVTDDAAERASLKSATSDVTDMAEGSIADQPSKKRSMLSALTGARPKPQGKHPGASGSTSSLHRPDSAQGREDMPPRIRMAAGIGVQVRGRSVLVKAPVFST